MQHATKHDERVHSETYKHCTLNARMIDMGASFVSLIFIACMWSCSSYTKRAIDDQLHSLPGADTPLLSNHFSGFLPVTKEKFIHYMYVESERDPVKDSIIFWTNGGPGCSGLLGLFTEMGPWRPIANKKLERNPFSWTTIAGMVFLEQPAGVGFSYSTNLTVYSGFNDFRASKDNLQIIKQFFERFPEKKGQDFYIASESYGGHYIPQWTLQIFDDPHGEDLRKRFKGYLVGNPFTSFASGSIAMANIMWGLQLIPKPAWDLMTESSCDSLSLNAYYFAEHLPQCFAYMEALFDYAAELNPYALEFPVCPAETPLRRRILSSSSMLGMSVQTSRQMLAMKKKISSLIGGNPSELYRSHFETMKYQLEGVKERLVSNFSKVDSLLIIGTQGEDEELKSPPRDPRAMYYDACTEHYTYEYLTDSDVQKGLHVSPEYRNGESEWGFCDDDVNGNWALSDYFSDTTPLYSAIYNHRNKPNGFKMLVFSGDSDGVCATIGTQTWIYNINGSEIKSLYTPWYYDDSIYGSRMAAGFLTKFSNFLSFATVHFAGHEVPAYQPEKALALLKGYINGSIFYNDSVVVDITEESTLALSNGDHYGSTIAIIMAISLLVTAVIGLFVCFYPRSTIYNSLYKL